MPQSASRNGTVCLIFAALCSLLLLAGQALAVDYRENPSGNLTGADWNGESWVLIQPASDPGNAISVKMEGGTGAVAGDLSIMAVYRDDYEESANVELSMDGARVTFGGYGGLVGTEGATALLTLTNENSGTGAYLGFNNDFIIGINAQALVLGGSTLAVGADLVISEPLLEMPFPADEEDIDNVDSTLDIKGGTVEVGGTAYLQAGRISVRDGGSMEVGAFHMYGSGYAAETFIRTGASFKATDSDVESLISGGLFHIESGGPNLEFLGGFHVSQDAVMNINRDIDVGHNGMKISKGGEVNMNWVTITGEYVHIDNGKLNFFGGELGGTNFVIEGDESQVLLGGVISSYSNVTISGGKTFFLSGSTADIASLNVGGTAEVHIATALSTAGGPGSFSFIGGDIYLEGSSLGAGSLDIGYVGQELTLRGNLHMMGGDALFRDDITWSGGGGIFVETSLTGIDMNGRRLTIGHGSTLDASAGNLVVANSGGLTVSGTYIAGYNGNNVTLASTTGGGALHLSSQAQIQLSSALQRQVNAPGVNLSSYLILASDSTSYNGATELAWNSGGWEYLYEMRQDAGGNWGLYITGAEYLTEEVQYENLLKAWRKIPEVGDEVRKIITPEFAGVVIRANGIVTGASGDYDSLASAGKFNADALSSLQNPQLSGATYDALMLYNGSGLGMVSQAVINSNYNLLRRLRQRNDHLRQEIRLSSELSCMTPQEYVDSCLDGDKNRFWAGGFYTNENSGRNEGFDGYHYRTTGMIVGYDRLLGNLSIGGSFSYAGGDFEDSSALSNSSHINTYGFLVYGSYNAPTGWFLNGALGYTYSDDQLRDFRKINEKTGWNEADFHTNTFLANVNLGYDKRFGQDLTITGSIGISYQNATNTAHTQYFRADDGTIGSSTLVAGAIDNESLTLPLEIGFKYDLLGDEDQLLSIFGNVGYAYEFDNTGPEGRISYAGLEHLGGVGIVNRHPGRHVLNLGIGLKYYYKQFEFGASYEYSGRAKYNSHHFLGHMGVMF